MVFFASRDKYLPLWLKCIAIGVAAYAFSPIDLIPDFIPVLGLLDDLVLLPAGIALILRFAPTTVIERARTLAKRSVPKPSSRWVVWVIVMLWVVFAVLAFVYVQRLVK